MATTASSARANRTHVCIVGGAAACTPIPISRISTQHLYIFIHIYNIYIYMHTYTYLHVSRLCYAQLYLHTCTPAHARAHMSANTSASAHRRSLPRTTARAASNARRARPTRTGAPPGRQGGAYIGQRGDTGGVPRADVRVECRRHEERLRAEPPAVHADSTRSHASARMRGRPIPHAHARAQAQHVRARVRRARIGDPFVRVASRAWIQLHWVYIHCICARSIDGWRYKESTSHSHTCRV